MSFFKLFLISMRAQVESDIHGFRSSGGLPITISPAARYTCFEACCEGLNTLVKQCHCCCGFKARMEVSGRSTVHLLDRCSSQPQHCYHQVMIPKIINISRLPVTYVYKATSKSRQPGRSDQRVHQKGTAKPKPPIQKNSKTIVIARGNVSFTQNLDLLLAISVYRISYLPYS